MRQRKTIRTQLKNPRLYVGGKYSSLMRFANKKKPGFKKKVKKIIKNKPFQKAVFTAATVGTLIAVLPKSLLNRASESAQKLGENVFDIADGLGSTAGSVVRAIGVGTDVFSNGLGFFSENFGTIIGVVTGGFVLNKFV